MIICHIISPISETILQVDISEVPGCYLFWQVSSQWVSQKLLQGLVSHELTAYPFVSDLFLTQWIMVILSKRCKPGNCESQSSLKPGFANIRSPSSNFAECEFFLGSNSLTFWICERQTWMTQLILVISLWQTIFL